MTTTPASTQRFDVFFSYDHDDAGWADRLRVALETRGVRVWVDSAEIRAAERWGERLETGLKSSRIYAFIVTAKGLQSRWVRDEYLGALTLANAPGGELQLIPLLVEDVTLPVFLSIRQWVDFREPERFEQSVEELFRGIVAARGKSPEEAAAREAGSAVADQDSAVTANVELEYLGRALRRESQTVREMWAIRIVAAMTGLVLSAWLLASGIARGWPVLALGNVLVTGLIGWGATVRRMSAARLAQSKLSLLREGIEVCQGRQERWCEKLQLEFWRTLHGSVGATAAD